MNMDSRRPGPVSRQPLSATGFRNRPAPAWLRLSCVALLLVATLSANAAVSIFMRIGGAPASNMQSTQTTPLLPGESTDPQYPNWNSLLSVSSAISLPVSFSSGGGGTTVGTPQHTDITITKLADKSTPSVNLLANGVDTGLPVTLPIDYVTIDFRTSTGPVVFYRLVLEGVYVTSVKTEGGGEMVTEAITFKYQRIRWTYVPYASGKAGPAVTKGWDLIKNGPY